MFACIRSEPFRRVCTQTNVRQPRNNDTVSADIHSWERRYTEQFAHQSRGDPRHLRDSWTTKESMGCAENAVSKSAHTVDACYDEALPFHLDASETPHTETHAATDDIPSRRPQITQYPMMRSNVSHHGSLHRNSSEVVHPNHQQKRAQVKRISTWTSKKSDPPRQHGIPHTCSLRMMGRSC